MKKTTTIHELYQKISKIDKLPILFDKALRNQHSKLCKALELLVEIDPEAPVTKYYQEQESQDIIDLLVKCVDRVIQITSNTPSPSPIEPPVILIASIEQILRMTLENGRGCSLCPSKQ